jgi:hypothetical protein
MISADESNTSSRLPFLFELLPKVAVHKTVVPHPSNIMRTIAITVALAILSPSLLFDAFAYPYQAPLQSGDGCIPKSYFVFLKPGYPFERHIAIVGTDKHVYFKAYELFGEPAGINDSYSAKDVDDALLAIIRSDPGVIKITCNRELGVAQEELIDWS